MTLQRVRLKLDLLIETALSEEEGGKLIKVNKQEGFREIDKHKAEEFAKKVGCIDTSVSFIKQFILHPMHACIPPFTNKYYKSFFSLLF